MEIENIKFWFNVTLTKQNGLYNVQTPLYKGVKTAYNNDIMTAKTTEKYQFVALMTIELQCMLK